MKALRLVEPKNFQIVDIPEPIQDGNHVIIDVEMVGLCGSDLTLWKGTRIFGSGHIMGHEYCGTVVDPGPRKDLCIGDRVAGIPANYCRNCFFCNNGMENLCNETVTKGGPGVTIDGACTARFAVLADKAFKLGSGVKPELGALVEPIANGHHAAITRGNVQAGEKILIIGGGIIAILTAWWAKKQGAYIVMSEINEGRIAHLKKFGVADEVVNPMEEGSLKAVQAKTRIGFDKIFECSHPNNKLFNETLIPMVRKGGTIIQVGSMEGVLSFNFFAFQYKELSYVSSWSITENDFTEAIWAVEKYPGEFLPHITSVISMEEVQSRMTAMASGKLQDVKVIIDPHR